MSISRYRGFRAMLMCCAAGCAPIAMPAFAQTNAADPVSAQTAAPADAASDQAPAQPDQSGDIVVTAQRREQSIQRVGISITAYSGDTLANLGVVSTTDIAAHVPGLQFDSGSGGGVNAFVTMRGVTQVDPAEHQEAPNAVYLDEVYVPTPSMVGFPLYDVARAEALRGPQGTLFGRNSTGGLLQFVTSNPTDDFSGFIDASYGNFNTVRLEGAVGGPVASGVSFRLAGFVNKADGFFKNYNTGPGGADSFETNTYGIRGKLAAAVGTWKVLLTGSINKSPRHHEGVYKSSPVYVDNAGTVQYLPANVDFYGTGPGNDPFGYRDPRSDPWSGSFNSDEGIIEKQFNYATLKLEGKLGGVTVTSITNYSFGLVDYSEDSDSTPNEINTFGNRGRTRQFSEELRLSGSSSRATWTGGLYYLHLNGDYGIDFALPLAPFTSQNLYTQTTKSIAAFAQLEYSFTDKLKLTLGGRYTIDSKDFDSQAYDLTGGGRTLVYDFSSRTVGTLARMRHGDWTGKVQLDYQANSDLLFYAGVSRGYRGGGFNATPDGSVSLAATPFAPETVIDYEGGAKLRLLNGAGSIRASAFYYDYTDFQAFNFQGSVGSVSNNNANFYGGELEASVTPLTGLDISLGASFLGGKIKNFRTPQGLVIDTEPLKAPKFSLNGIIAKSFDIGDYKLRFQYDFSYQSSSNANLVPSPITTLPSNFTQNARLSFGRAGGPGELYAYVRNLANSRRKSFAYDLSFVGIGLASYAPPRMYGIGYRKTF